MRRIMQIIRESFGTDEFGSDEIYIAGMRVSIEPNDDREGVNCWIENADGYSASLAAAEDNGVLYKGDDEMPIGNKTLDAIRRYAESKGY